ncbi:formate dehydrogenase subunit delta [Tropicimonas sp.]|uniref:formate dehydrogenase subunit delta n=1 Tax=Tropicimonas sp. TaxID=2067044 RepID=UPI003A8A731A
MSPEKLTYMSNQIATFFANRPEAEAVHAVATHINDFWEPRMRRQLLEIVAAGGADLSDLVTMAAPEIRRPAPE